MGREIVVMFTRCCKWKKEGQERNIRRDFAIRYLNGAIYPIRVVVI
jgi:hypothetical protein